MNSFSYAAMSAKYPPRFSDIQKVAQWCAAMVELHVGRAKRAQKAA